ncbi:MAG: MBL fold metallo-hydrolase [Bacillota bacterium]
MQIINLGNTMFNNYILKGDKGAILIDAGNGVSYENFLKALKKNFVDIKDIKYIFLTHAHSDHISYLKQLLQNTDIKIILHTEAVERLKISRNILGDCSSFMSKVFSILTKATGKSTKEFEKVLINKDKAVIVEGDSDFLKSFNMKILYLDGHTPDSIGLLTEDNILFCGDMFVNTFPSKQRRTLLIEDKEKYIKSWQKVIDLNPKKIYPSHGKPFGVEDIIKYQNKVENMFLWKNP